MLCRLRSHGGRCLFGSRLLLCGLHIRLARLWSMLGSLLHVLGRLDVSRMPGLCRSRLVCLGGFRCLFFQVSIARLSGWCFRMLGLCHMAGISRLLLCVMDRLFQVLLGRSRVARSS